MNRHHAVRLLLCMCVFGLSACTQISIAEQELLRSTATVVVETTVPAPPDATIVASEPGAVVGATMAPTSEPTSAATAEPSPTSEPTAIPLPATPVPDPALQGFSLCDQVAGDPAGGRFSARVTTITTTVEAKFERLELGLAVPDSSVPPHALARCISAADDALQTGAGQGSEGYTLLLSLDGWLHDDLFRASTVSPTLSLSGTTAIKGVSYRVPPNAEVGADVAISIEQPLPFRVALEQNPTRLVLEIAKTSTLTDTSNLLTQAAGNAAPATPIYYLQDGDIWQVSNGQPTNLTNSQEVETAIAVSEAAGQIAFCRAAAGSGAEDVLASSALWTMNLDGSDAGELAAPGRTCAEPVFSPDGATIAFTVDESGATPPRLSIYTVATDGGDETRLTPASDEWSRFGPQWLDGDRVVYAAQAEDNRSTLFINTQGTEEDIGAALTVGSTYASLGRPLAAPDGNGIAVEGLRADGSGANLLVLDTNGARTGELATGYWTRPLAWSTDGSLFYLVTDCPSSVAQNYSVFQQPAQGDARQIGFGTTLGGFGEFTATEDGLAYVALDRATPGARGTLALDETSPSRLWFWNVARGTRSTLVEAQSAISGVAR